MKINSNNYYNNYKVPQLQYLKQNRNDCASFKGHVGGEDFAHNSIKRLIHETAFFREAETDEFLKDFILTKWKHKPKINIVCGACSTGEEVITLSMVLNKIKNRVSILGLDISESSVNEAKSNTYRMSYDPYRNAAADQDMYLWINTKWKKLSPREKKYKSLFNSFFEEIRCEKQSLTKTTPSKKSIFTNILNRIIDFLAVDLSGERYEATYRLRNGKAQNCNFMQSDIMDIDSLMSSQKADIITFRNALYHLITEETEHIRYLSSSAQQTLDKILSKIKASLVSDGLIVIGSREKEQTLSKNLIPTRLLKNGFKPLNGNAEKATVWQKINK